MTSGSDHYLGDLTVENVADLYVGNAFMAAMHDADQPLTSLEFEAGLSDHGEDLSRQVPPSALALKTRLCLAQGNRLLNYYVFAGGHNPPLREPVRDGNDRIAFTGERHGFTAPVGPEGQLNPTYPVLRETVAAVHGAARLLADMDEEYDDVALGFVPDHYLTEYSHPADGARRDVVADLERYRGMGARDVLARALLLAGFSFPAVDLQSEIDTDRVIVLASPATLSADVQRRLAAFVLGGGRLLLAGVLPSSDVDGTPCTILADVLGLHRVATVNGTGEYFPSVLAESWTSASAEVRVGVLQRLKPADSVGVFARDAATGDPVGVDVRPGQGHALALTCDYPCHLDFWTALLGRLGASPRHTHDATAPGVVVTSTVDSAGQRLLHLLNVSPVDQTLNLRRHSEPLLGGNPIRLPARSGRILPLGIHLDGGTLAWSTCELASVTATSLALSGNGPGDRAELTTNRTVVADAEVHDDGGGTVSLTWHDQPIAAGRTVQIMPESTAR